ncbi:MAG: septal ring lytic transglycosylase RlpA family protein [Balneolaceae bacterium]
MSNTSLPYLLISTPKCQRWTRRLPPLPVITGLILIIFILQACGIARVGTESNRTDRSETGRMLQTGKASWYGPNFHGKATANGEVFNMNDLTAAHRTLPFNTVLQVQNLDNGRSVVVRINDRGPYVANRVIDLSRKAAQEIDMEDTGTANVEIYLMDEGDRPVGTNQVSNQEEFTIQLASYNTRDEARNFSQTISGTRVEEVPLGGRSVFRVYYGSYKIASSAKKDLDKLTRQGIDGFVKQAEN